jgi:hypothetical protein
VTGRGSAILEAKAGAGAEWLLLFLGYLLGGDGGLFFAAVLVGLGLILLVKVVVLVCSFVT